MQMPDFYEIRALSTDFHSLPSSTKFRGNPSNGNRADSCGETDGYDGTIICLSCICRRA